MVTRRLQPLVVVALVALVACAGCNSILGIQSHALAVGADAGGSDGGVDSNDATDETGVDAGASDASSCSAGGWCPYVRPHGPGALLALWADTPDDIWAVGDGGTILHRKKAGKWAATPVATSLSLKAVWGSKPEDVWTVGHDPAAAGAAPATDGGAPATDGGAPATDGGAILHWNGSAWSRLRSNTIEPLYGVWGSGTDDIWAVGQGGIILRGNAASGFSRVADPSLPDLSSVLLTGIWGSGANDVWIVGSTGTLVHWDGSVWKPFISPASPNKHLQHVWGAASDDVWAVGDSGTVLHFDGDMWRKIDPLSIGIKSEDLTSVWGATDGPRERIWVTGVSGALFGWSWNNAAMASAATVSAATKVSVTTQNLRSVGGAASGDVWAVGDNFSLFQWDGTSWSDGVGATRAGDIIKSVWGSAPDDVWAVGEGGTILHWNGLAWFIVESAYTTGLTGKTLNCVWGSAADDVWGGGAAGTILHWDGAAWCDVGTGLCHTKGGYLLPKPPPALDLHAVWGSSSKDVWFAGSIGTLVRWKGTVWSDESKQVPQGPDPSAGQPDLNAVWGSGPNNVIIVGQAGTILLSDGSGFSLLPPVTTDKFTSFSGVWGNGPSDVWIASDAGRLFRLNSENLMSECLLPPGSPQEILGIWGRADNLWAVGTLGMIVHSDGVGSCGTGGWIASDSGVQKFLIGVWGSAIDDVWAVGEDGTILHH
jgi:hypothetical protein